MQKLRKNSDVSRPATHARDLWASAGKMFAVVLLVAAAIRPTPVKAMSQGPDESVPKPMSCADLAGLSLPNTTITSATTVPAGPFSDVSVGDPYAAEGTTSAAPTCSSATASPQLPVFCRVTGAISEPSAAEPINFEVWLPLYNWNGSFETVGNHGFAGEFEYADMGPELVKGFAVAATDTGHAGSSATAWMQNAQQIIDYGYLGIHETTVKGKAVVKAFYGTPAKYSYFNGCSTGGKEGLMEAQRYPDDYNGINVAGSANFNQIHNREEYVWNGQATFGNAATPLNTAQLTLVNSAAIAQCDGLDGVVDGVIDNPLTCPFKPSSLLCTAGQDPSTCLTAAQAEAFHKVYEGPHNPITGQEIYTGLGIGTELGWASETSSTGSVSTAQTFFEYMVYNQISPPWNFETFNFSSDVISTDAQFAILLDAIDPDLSAFRSHGGKILQSHLWNSVVHPAERSILYYDQVVSFMNGGKGQKVLNSQDFDQTQEFYRLFMAPGGTGSDGPGTFDSMPYLQRWVEQGSPPTSILASHETDDVVDRTRPLCPYPAYESYQGSGSTDEAQNFQCLKPNQVPNYFVLANQQFEPSPAPPKPQR
jgi:feruloyl esterase